MDTKALLRGLPQVDEVMKSRECSALLEKYPRAVVLKAVRGAIDARRAAILAGSGPEVSMESLVHDAGAFAKRASSMSLRPVINATGVVMHTNLGRSVLPPDVLENIMLTSGGYSNLEYDLAAGRRGKRHSHLGQIIREVTGAEDGLAVNNNAAAVFLSLGTLASGREVVVSRGELVEIGGSFRIPDVIRASGAILREVGTTNKTHMRDYEAAISGETAILLKVHRSNYRVSGFTEEVSVEKLAALGKRHRIPLVFDLGSGSLVDLRPLGVHDEPTVREAIEQGADLVTFSGDKLLGGPQAGLIAGRSDLIERIQQNPVARAVRMDKMTIAALEATLRLYADPEHAVRTIPTLRMLFEGADSIKARARRLASRIRREAAGAEGLSVRVVEEMSQSGGGALPEVQLPSYAAAVRSTRITPNALESALRLGEPPVIARIRDDALILDARTIDDKDIPAVAGCVARALAATSNK